MKIPENASAPESAAPLPPGTATATTPSPTPTPTPLEAEHYVVGYYIQALLEAYTAQGGALDVLAKKQNVPSTWLCQPPQKISVDNYLQLIASAQQITGDENLGLHIGQHMHASTFDVLGQALLKVDTLGQALEQVLALEGFVHTLGHSQVFQEPGYIRVVWRCYYQLHPLARELAESVLAGIIHFSQMLAGRPIPVMEATFVHDHPNLKSMAEYRRICRSTCYFGQAYNSILVADDVLAWPVNPVMQSPQASFTPQRSRSPQSHAASAPLSHQLSHYLESILAQGNPVLSKVAEHYHMTARTLQRRLGSENTSFQQILSDVRIRLAEDYLSYSTMNIFEISQMLGFKEQSSFNHFFSERLGVTPSEFRQRHSQKT